MSDIVQYLRETAEFTTPHNPNDRLYEAADKLEELATENGDLKQYGIDMLYFKDAQFERAEAAEAALAEKDMEISDATHDIERQVKVLVEQSDEITALEARCRELEAEIEEMLTTREVELSTSYDDGHYRAISEHATPWKAQAQKLREALENSCNLLEGYIDTFGDMSGSNSADLNDYMTALSLTPTSALAAVRDETLNGLKMLCGYVGNGTNEAVTIFQDDATYYWHVKIGKHYWYGRTLKEALAAAIRARKETGE